MSPAAGPPRKPATAISAERMSKNTPGWKGTASIMEMTAPHPITAAKTALRAARG